MRLVHATTQQLRCVIVQRNKKFVHSIISNSYSTFVILVALLFKSLVLFAELASEYFAVSPLKDSPSCDRNEWRLRWLELKNT
jgi:hypothetical protein